MRGRIAERAKRIQRLDGLLRLVRGIHALRLVDDDDGPRRLHELDGLAAGELVALLVDDVALLLLLRAGEILAEGVDVDDQNLQRVAGGKLAQPVHLLRVIDEMLEWQVVVERPEMLGGDLDVLEHAFADGDARHDDDELLEAVAARQLEDRPQIDVGLARARFHLDREMRARRAARWRPDQRAPSPPAQPVSSVTSMSLRAWTARAFARSLASSSNRAVAEAQLAALLPGEQFRYPPPS